MSSRFKLLTYILLLTLLLTSLSCSGGSSGGNKKGNQTAVRVLHAGLDAIPVGLFIGQNFIGETRYLGNSIHLPVSQGESILRLTRSDRFDEPVIEFPVNLLKATEYTLFLYGEVKKGTFQVRLIEEPIIVPEKDMARVQFLHGLIDQGSLRFQVDGINNDVQIGFGDNSNFIDIPSGNHRLRVFDNSGRLVTETRFDASSQSEMTILIGGKSSFNFVSIKVYEDFD